MPVKKLIFYEGKIYNTAELAQLLNKSTQTIRKQLNDGKLTEYEPALHTDNDTELNYNTEKRGREYYMRLYGEWISTTQLAERLNTTKETINRWRRNGTLPAHIKYKDSLYDRIYIKQADKNHFTTYRFFLNNDEPNGIAEFYYNVKQQLEAIPNYDKIRIVLRFEDPKSGDWRLRTVKFTDATELGEAIYKLGEQENLYGSDNLYEGMVWDKSFFMIKALNVNHGGGYRNSIKYKSKYFQLQEYYHAKNGDNNCLLYILKVVTGTKTHAKSIRMRLGLEEKSIITLQQLPIIESCLDVAITVYNSEKEILYTPSDLNKTHQVDVLLQDGHYLHITEIKNVSEPEIVQKPKTKPKPKPKKEPKNIYKNLFFDIETVFDPKSNFMLVPYAVAWKVADGELYISIGVDRCMVEFVKFILCCTNLGPNEVYRLIGFNNSRFDNFILCHYLHRFESLISVTYMNNTIYNLTYGNLRDFSAKTFDLCQFLKSSLKEACKNFNTQIKKLDGFDHTIPQACYKNNKFDIWLRAEDENIRKYITNDVLSLEELFNITDEAITRLTNKKMTNYLTIAGMAYDIFKENNTFETFPDEKIDDLFRASMIGGRTQSFVGKTKIKCPEGMYFGDVNSLYPYAMSNNEFPTGGMREVDSEENGKLGIYNCIINQNIEEYLTDEHYRLKKPCVIPNRVVGETLDWNYRENIERVLTSVDIKCCRDAGFTVEVHNGVVFDNTSNHLFTNYIQPFKNEKTRQDTLKGTPEYNGGVRAICKLFLNSLSGKLMQRNYAEISSVIKSEKDVERFFLKVDIDSVEFDEMGGGLYYIQGNSINRMEKCKPSYIGSFIYSYSRTHMYDNILSKHPVYYMDTDSCLMSTNTYNQIDKNLFGGEFGQLSDDVGINFNTAYIVAPKTYGLFNDDKVVKTRAKGVNVNSDKYAIGKFDDIDSLPTELYNVCNLQFYKTLVKGGNVTVATQTLNRGLEIVFVDGKLKKVFKLTQNNMLKIF